MRARGDPGPRPGGGDRHASRAGRGRAGPDRSRGAGRRAHRGAPGRPGSERRGGAPAGGRGRSRHAISRRCAGRRGARCGGAGGDRRGRRAAGPRPGRLAPRRGVCRAHPGAARVKLFAVARRDLAAYLHSPAAFLVAALFLAVQGWSFWLFVSLANGRATQWTALRLFFGGSLLYWLFVFFLAAVITMRTIAEERRTGTIEPLLTAPIAPASVVLGKYLGALGFYAALWLPTVTYVVILARYSPGAPDPGPILGGYFGTMLCGASALAVGVCASSLTQHQLAAAALAFLALLGLLLAGAAAPAVLPEGALRPLLGHLDLPRQMDEFGRGVIDLRPLALHLGLTVCALWWATCAVAALAAAPGSGVRHACEIVLVVAIAAALNLAAARHPRRVDLTRGRVNTLAPRSEAILARLDRPVDVTLLMLPSGGPADPYEDVRSLLALYQARSPRLRVSLLGEGERDRARALGTRFRLDAGELADGAVVFESGARFRVVPRSQLARIEQDDAGAPRIAAFTAEQAFDAALLALTLARPSEICFTRGHGELAIDSLAEDGMSDLGDALRRDDATLRTLATLDHGVPPSCDVTVLAGPERAFAASEAASLEAALTRGQRLLVLVGAPIDPDGSMDPALTPLRRLGIEDFLLRHGVKVHDAVAFDPSLMSRRELAWAVDEGYADHPITRTFPGRRTVWSQARVLAAAPGPGQKAVELVRTGDDGWGETDLASVVRDRGRLAFDAGRDQRGPVAVAVAVEQAASRGDGRPARLVVLGSRDLARNDHDVSYNRDLLTAAVGWLANDDAVATLGPQTPEQLRLRLDDGQLARIFLVCVVGLPLCALLVGAGVWWRRRR
ncbi:MAG: hypothetical protein EXR72_21485 [Myxococcales bacterium]|nr:hypothetical protein [Myxococcales bacterium]